jgi:hypothetical protein
MLDPSPREQLQALENTAEMATQASLYCPPEYLDRANKCYFCREVGDQIGECKELKELRARTRAPRKGF